MCRFGWMQWQFFQIFFIELIFVFFMTLFLKRMGIILSASKPHCDFRLSKPILKILAISRKNISGKYALNTFSDCFIHQTFNFNIFCKIKYDDQSYQTVHSRSSTKKAALMNFIGKHLCRSLFLLKFHAYRLKKDSCAGVFLWVLPNISERFFAELSGWLLLLNTFFCLLGWPQPQK